MGVENERDGKILFEANQTLALGSFLLILLHEIYNNLLEDAKAQTHCQYILFNAEEFKERERIRASYGLFRPKTTYKASDDNEDS